MTATTQRHSSPSSPPEPRSVLDYLGRATSFLATHGTVTPRLDAEVLLAAVLATDRVGIYLRFDQPLAPGEVEAFRALLKRRAAGEPVAYLTGRREFWSRPLQITPAVLIPRPETELVVEHALAAVVARAQDGGSAAVVARAPDAALAAASGGVTVGAGSVGGVPAAARPRDRGLRILDLGTGSGALAVALASELPEAWVVAVDISRPAAAVAQANAVEAGVADRVAVLVADWAAALLSTARFDLIVSNPPYVETAMISGLALEVRQEPALALDGGPDGLAAYRVVVPAAAALLAPGGQLLVEVGEGQAAPVAALARGCGLDAIACHRDLARIERVVAAVRRARVDVPV